MIPVIAHAEEAHFFSMEHLHVLLNHLPIIGLGMGILALLMAFLLRNRQAQIVALVLVFVSAASAWPVNFTGQRAYKSIRSLTDEAGTDWLDVHMERAERTAPIFYVLAALAAVAMIAPRKWPRSTQPLAVATLVVAMAAAGAGGWVALAGGQIRHPEFRTQNPPAAESATPHSH